MNKISKYLSKNEARWDIDCLADSMNDAYHPMKNPNGIIHMNIAENKEAASRVGEYFYENLNFADIPDWSYYYTQPVGSEFLRMSFCRYYQWLTNTTSLNSECVYVSAGLTAVIEQTIQILCTKEQEVHIPAPYYPGYVPDIEMKAGAKVVEWTADIINLWKNETLIVELENRFLNLSNGEKSEAVLILTQPNNPDGRIYPEPLIRLIGEWCHNNYTHLIVNEMYALTYCGDAPFYSFMNEVNDLKSPYLHLWYGASKDFGLSGHRLGMLYSHNKRIADCYPAINAGAMASNMSQWLWGTLLSDQDFIAEYSEKMNHAICAERAKWSNIFLEYNIPISTQQAALFIWIDFRRLKDKYASSHELWQELNQTYGLLCTSGHYFGSRFHFYMRISFTALDQEENEEARARMESFLKNSYS